MDLTKSSQVKMMVALLAIMVLMSSAAAAISPQDLILKPLNLGRKLLARHYYGRRNENSYDRPGGGGGYPCCN
ncbi:hypothetical protein REPUB_Repub15cG0100500 [Reevesia pubescens]